MKPKLLIVDDDKKIRIQLKEELAVEYEILLAEDRATSLEQFRSANPSVVLLDLGLPPQPDKPEESLAVLSVLLSLKPRLKVMVIVGPGEKQKALRAVGLGAYHCLTKPVDLDELRHALKRCFYVVQLEEEYAEMQKLVRVDSFEGIQGNSPRMRPVFELISKVAVSDAPVLILGESGTGKEMVARAIHQRSHRKNGPFIAINCGAIPENLVESELFGHEKGAFTGAQAQRKGRIEMANNGTLFLDEIGEIPLALQVKLLRFLQEQTVQHIGGSQEISANARIVAATNVDLRKVIAANSFREDLYYRLAVVQIMLPPLRERDSDVRLLAEHFLTRFGVETHKPYLTFDQDALRAINKHIWPGNVRELENCIRRAVIMAEGRRIMAEDLELSASADAPTFITLKEAREAVDRQLILRALEIHSGNLSAAAVELGISRTALYELMSKLDIKWDKE